MFGKELEGRKIELDIGVGEFGDTSTTIIPDDLAERPMRDYRERLKSLYPESQQKNGPGPDR